MPDSGFNGDPMRLTPRQLVAYAILAQEEEARRDERLYFMMSAAAMLPHIPEEKAREKADKETRQAIRGKK